MAAAGGIYEVMIGLLLQALEGNPVDVDAVIEVLMGADLSPAVATASEAGAHSHTFSSQSRQPQQLPAPPGEASMFQCKLFQNDRDCLRWLSPA